MIRENVLRKTGVGVAAFGPVLGVVLQYLGVGQECTPEMVEAGCVSAPQMAGAFVTMVGGAIFWVGQNRAHNRDKQDKPQE